MGLEWWGWKVMTSLHKKNLFRFPRRFQVPVGEIDGTNIDYLIPNDEEFYPGTLQILVDGNELCPQSFEETGTTGFKIIVEPSDPNARNKPFRQSETVWLHYFRKPKCK